ncbi:hypothetical protein KA005_78465, partial [bacterium]|nr:hypothetical protein [bacterium]
FIERSKKMENIKNIINLVLKAVAVGMSVTSIVMGFFPGETTIEPHIPLLSIGLATVAVAALQNEDLLEE